jgi:hypothetical protein
MNQFIIENPVLCIVIAFIIGAVIMNITSALTVRMAVEKEVTKALRDEEEEEETRELWDAEDYSISPNAVLTVYFCVDGDGCRCLYLAAPDHYKQGEGPLSELGHDYYYHPTLQFLADDFDLDKLAELGIDIRPEKEYEPMAYSLFILRGENVLKFLEEAFNACGKAIARE